MTTFSLMIAALADYLESNPDKAGFLGDLKISALRKNYLFNDDDYNGLARYKLVLSQDDKETLFSIVSRSPVPDEKSDRIVENHAFFRENLKLRAEVEELEHKSRRRDILVDDEALFEFYDQRISHDVISARHFDSWWKKASKETPDLLNFEKSMLIKEGAEQVSKLDYPNFWHQGNLKLRLTYQFEPGADAGVQPQGQPATNLCRNAGDGEREPSGPLPAVDSRLH